MVWCGWDVLMNLLPSLLFTTTLFSSSYQCPDLLIRSHPDTWSFSVLLSSGWQRFFFSLDTTFWWASYFLLYALLHFRCFITVLVVLNFFSLHPYHDEDACKIRTKPSILLFLVVAKVSNVCPLFVPKCEMCTLIMIIVVLGHNQESWACETDWPV